MQIQKSSQPKKKHRGVSGQNQGFLTIFAQYARGAIILQGGGGTKIANT